jgi:hypothetical protein
MASRHDETVGGDLLERGLEALRGQDLDVDGIQIAATRSRVLQSLDRGAARRRRSVGTAIAAVILGTGTLSWAVATGRLDTVMEAVGISERAEVQPVERPRMTATVPSRELVPELEPTAVPDAATETAPDTAPDTATAPEIAAPRAPRNPDRDRRERAMFRAAHDLHFKRHDTTAALAAWDAYLATAPAGKLAVEARYNRALALVRLGRRDEAIAALAPFERGDIAPAGYRQREARALLRALGATVTESVDDTAGGQP